MHGLCRLWVLAPSGLKTRVRSLQAYGEEREQVFAGERTAVNLHGLEKSEIERGEVLARPDSVIPTSMVDIFYTHLSSASSPLPPRSKMLIHSGSAALMGTVVVLNGRELMPGDQAYVQVRLEKPSVIVFNDRIVMRGLKVNFTATLIDITPASDHPHWHAPDDYSAAHLLGQHLRDQQHSGIHYESVRAAGSHCYALLSPQIIASITPSAHYEYIWDGEKIAHTLTIRRLS
jgi:hypothetical protein